MFSARTLRNLHLKQLYIMEKRTFLKSGLFLGFAAAASSFIEACTPKAAVPATLPPPARKRTEPFTLPKLGFYAGDLEPNIDKQTMEIHHGKHHNAYVTNLNDAVKDTIYADYELTDILDRITDADTDKKIRNNAGGHWNHSFFWETITPGASGVPTGKLAEAIDKTFESYDKFREQFSTAAKSVFGSGWVWLCADKKGNLFISTTPNQDNPLMKNIVKQTGTPIIGLDVWEHAYYLKYQNKRPDYINAFYTIINWKTAADRYEQTR